jgi:GMP synthase-like glutamine amidotransferase
VPARRLRVHVLQHVPFEGLGCIEPWLDARGATRTTTRFFESAGLPSIDTFDLLVALGGPMSVNDDAALPWLAAEKRLVADAIAAGRRVLGICLGAQLIAAACGARVYPNHEREIGWHFVAQTGAPWAGSSLPARFLAFHWHGETFDLPPGAQACARSAACEHQAFTLGRNVLGLQFHLESTPATVRALVENCPADLAPGPYVQAEGAMLAEPRRFADANAAMENLLEAFLAPDV